MSSMVEINQNQYIVRNCTFQVYLEKSRVNLRFPATFFVQWKSINGKNVVSMQSRKKAVNSVIELGETLTFVTEMLYHKTKKEYLKKQSIIHLNLISNSRPDQVKLVGRVLIDLSQIANRNTPETINTYKLLYCSVEADISLSIKLISSVESNIDFGELDRSSFSDLYSFPNSKNKSKIELKEFIIQKKIEEQKKLLVNTPSINMLKDDEMQGKRKEIDIKDIKKQQNNILIRQSDELNEENQSLHSLPLTQKKIIDTRREGKRSLEDVIKQEKGILEGQINEHKDRIKKLEEDIKEVIGLFRNAQTKSQANHIKLSEAEKEIKKLKQQHESSISVLKESYQADIKILKSTIQEQRLRAQDTQPNPKIIQEYEILANENTHLKAQLKQKDIFNTEFIDMKKQISNLLAESQSLKTQKANILQRINEYETELKTERQNKQISKQQLINLQNEKDQLIVEILALRQNNQNLLKKNQEMNASFQKQSQQNDRLITQMKLNLESQVEKALKNLAQVQEQNLKLTETIANNYVNTSSNEIGPMTPKTPMFNDFGIDAEAFNSNNKANGSKRLEVIQENFHIEQLELEELKKQNETLKDQIKSYLSGKNNQTTVKLPTVELNDAKNQSLKPQKQQPYQLLKLELSNKQNQIQSLKNQLSRSYTQNNELLQKLSAKNKQFDDLVMVYEKSKTQNNAKSISLISEDYLKQQIELLKAEIEKMKTNKPLEDVQKENDQLKKQIQNLRSEIFSSPIYGEKKQVRFVCDEKSIEHHPDEVDYQIDHFDFDHNNNVVTAEDINKISEVRNVDEEMIALRDENLRLKEQNEGLKSKTKIQFLKVEGDNQKQNNSVVAQDNNQILKQKQALQEHIKYLKQQIAINNHRNNSTQPDISLQKLNYQQTINALSQKLAQQKQKNQELIHLHQINTNRNAFENEGNIKLYSDLQARVEQLQEELKIKQQILMEADRNIEDNYAVKYQLAELKDKLTELTSALQEREEVVVGLEEQVTHLSKQLQQYMRVDKEIKNFQVNDRIEIEGNNHEIELLKQKLIEISNQLNQLRIAKEQLEKENEELIISLAQLKASTYALIEQKAINQKPNLSITGQNKTEQKTANQKQVEAMVSIETNQRKQQEQKSAMQDNVPQDILNSKTPLQQLAKLQSKLDNYEQNYKNLELSQKNWQIKYIQLNNHYQNCLTDIQFYQFQSQQFSKIKKNLEQTLYQKNQLLETLQNRIKQLQSLSDNTKIAGEISKENKEVEIGSHKEDRNEIIELTPVVVEGPSEVILHKLDHSDPSSNALVENLNKVIDTLKTKNIILTENIANLQSSLQSQIEINQNSNSKNKMVTTSLENKISQLNSQLDQLRAVIQVQKQKNNHSQKQREHLLHQNTLLVNQNENVQRDLQNKGQDELAIIKAQHNNCAAEKVKWGEQLENISLQLQHKEELHHQELRSLQNQIQDLRNNSKMIEDNMQEIKDALAFAERNKQQMQEQNHKLAEQLFEVQSQQYEQSVKFEEAALEYQRIKNQLELKKGGENLGESEKIKQLNNLLSGNVKKVQQLLAVNSELEIKIEQTKNSLFLESDKTQQLQKLLSQQILKSNQLQLVQKQNEMLNQRIIQLELDREAATSQSVELETIKQELEAIHLRLQKETKLKEALVEKDQSNIIELKNKQNNETLIVELKQQIKNQVKKLEEVSNQNKLLIDQNRALKEEDHKSKNLFGSKVLQFSQGIKKMASSLGQKDGEIIKLMRQKGQLVLKASGYENKIKQLIQRQQTMKQTIITIEVQSRKLITALKNREKSQLAYYNKLMQKEKQYQQLILAASEARQEIINKDRLTANLQQKINQLQLKLNDIQLPQAAADKGERASDFEKYEQITKANEQLLRKNRQYLEALSSKSTISITNQQLKGQINYLNGQINHLNSSIVQIKSSNQQLIQKLTSQLNEVKIKNIEYEKQLGSLKNQIQLQKIDDQKNFNKALSDFLEQKNKELKKLELQIDQLNTLLTQQNLIKKEDIQQNIQRQNEQVNKLKQEIQILKKGIQNKNIQIQELNKEKNQILNSKITNKSIAQERKKILSQLQDHKKRQEEYMLHVLDLQEQMVALKSNLQKDDQSKKEKHQSLSNVESVSLLSHDLLIICQEIKELCRSRRGLEDSQNLFQLLVNKNSLMQEKFELLNTETSSIQQKARFISKQLQKVKSHIIKSQNRVYKQKTQLLALLKPCEVTAGELVSLSQILSERESQA